MEKVSRQEFEALAARVRVLEGVPQAVPMTEADREFLAAREEAAQTVRRQFPPGEAAPESEEPKPAPKAKRK